MFHWFRSLRSKSGECIFLCTPLGLLDGCLWSSIEAILCPRTGNARNTNSPLNQTSDLIFYCLTRRMETLRQRRSCLASTLPGKWIQGEEMSRLSGSERRFYQLYSLIFLIIILKVIGIFFLLWQCIKSLTHQFFLVFILEWSTQTSTATCQALSLSVL